MTTEERDWNKYFTEAFRSERVQKAVDEIFKGKKTIRLNREEYEEIIVKVSVLILKGTDYE